MRQVVCMKWGDLYGSAYVNRLYSMVRRETSGGELRFVCLTDDREGIRDEVECHPCPTVDIPPPHNLRGWRKLSLFAPSDALFGFEGDWLYLDLDVVVTGPLDDFFAYKPDEPYVVMQNWTQPGSGIGNTSVQRFRIGHDADILENLLNNQNEVFGQFTNSQTYVSRTIKRLAFWPDEWCVLFKVQCVPAWPVRFWKAPVLPEGARVIAFPGVPNPDQALRGEWPERKLRKRLYKTIQPAEWIREYWR